MKMDINLSLGSWLFIQVTLLVIHYGFGKTLPWWALWFPLLVIAGIVALGLFIIIILFIFGKFFGDVW